MTNTLLCTMEEVEKRYDTGPYQLGPVSLRIYAGEIVGLRGPNGAGKSTILKLLAGLLRPDRGSISRAPELEGRVGYVPQEVALYDTLTGMENLLFWGSVYGLPGKVAKTRARWLLQQMELTDKARVKSAAYSGGMRRRLHLATALMATPSLLLLDEPTVGSDLHSAELILSTLRHLRDLGCAQVLVTHQAGELERVCDRILDLKDGRLADGGDGT